MFTRNVDDAPSECDLDTDVTFDLHVENDGNDKKFNEDLQKLLQIISSKLKRL